MNLAAVTWELSRAPEAVSALAAAAGLRTGADVAAGPTAAPRDIPDDEEAQTGWVRHYVSAIAEQLDLDAFHANVSYEALEEILRAAPPALIWIPGGEPAGVLALLRCKGRDAVLLAPDGATVRVPLIDLCDRLTQRWRAPLDAWVDDTLAPIALPARRRADARRRLLAQRLRGTLVTAAWYLRETPHGSILRQAVQIGLRRRTLRLVVSHVLFQAAWILAWMLLGRAVLDGAVDGGWMWGSVTLLMLLVPLRLVGAWSQALVSVGGAGLIKSWLLRGALSLDPADVQRHGSGELIGKSMEAAAFESSAVEGVFMLLLAAIEFLAATIVLLMGASPGWAMLALVIWVGIWLFMLARYRARLRRWTRLRVGMTRELVEQMVGYRTRLVQLPQGLWHHGEDRQVQAYLEESTALDRRHAHLRVLPRAYLVLAVLALVPSFLGEEAATGIAIAVGGIMLMAGALYRLVEGSLGLASAAMAWDEIAPLMAARAQARPRPAPIARSRESRPGEPVLELHDVSHRYAGSDWLVLDRCNLTVRAGDRVLIEGPSGAGKSTLAALAAGMASPQSGLILFRGLDLETLGEEGWRKAIVLAPQFHHNHVFSGSLNFNLFLGNWPPRMQEIEEAAELFEELGLGPMLAGMPSGLQQVVGENGWMLSHGERSRLFIARALLQRAEVVILDESFAALDPDTLRRAVECARRRARTLVVVAHP